jgi:hypothetical protein
MARLPGSYCPSIGFADDAVEPRALEAIEPLLREPSIARDRREVERRLCLREQRFELRATLQLRVASNVLPVHREQIETDEGGGRLPREFRGARAAGWSRI